MVQLLVAGVIGIFFLICILIGIFSMKKNDSEEGFFLSERKVGTFTLSATVTAGYVGAGFLLSNTALIFQFGISAAWIFIGLLFGFLLFSKFGVFLKGQSDEKRFFTLSDYFRKYGKLLSALSIFAVFILYFGSSVNQFVGGAKILEQVSGWNYLLSLILMGSVILLYLLLGGFRSVLKTDVFQYFIILIFPIILVFTFTSGVSLPASYFNIFHAGIVNIVAFFVYGILTNFMFAELWQRVYAAKSKETVRKAFLISGLTIIALGVIITYLGLVARTAFENADPDIAAVLGITKLVPEGIAIFSLLFLFAVIMSSIDTVLFVLATNISQDILGKKNRIRNTKIALALMTVLSIGIAVIYPNMINIIILYSAIGLAFSPAVVISWLGTLNKKAMSISYILTVLTVISVVIIFHIISPALALAAIFESFILYFLLFKIVGRSK